MDSKTLIKLCEAVLSHDHETSEELAAKILQELDPNKASTLIKLKDSMGNVSYFVNADRVKDLGHFEFMENFDQPRFPNSPEYMEGWNKAESEFYAWL